jgi:hypothetical protein
MSIHSGKYEVAKWCFNLFCCKVTFTKLQMVLLPVLLQKDFYKVANCEFTVFSNLILHEAAALLRRYREGKTHELFLFFRKQEQVATPL